MTDYSKKYLIPKKNPDSQSTDSAIDTSSSISDDTYYGHHKPSNEKYEKFPEEYLRISFEVDPNSFLTRSSGAPVEYMDFVNWIPTTTKANRIRLRHTKYGQKWLAISNTFNTQARGISKKNKTKRSLKSSNKKRSLKRSNKKRSLKRSLKRSNK